MTVLDKIKFSYDDIQIRKLIHINNRFNLLGWILIDRCGKHFGTILNFLRDGHVFLPDSHRDLMELEAEAKYFCIAELAEAAAEKSLKHLKDKEGNVVPICRVPLITSQKEEQVIQNTVDIKLLIHSEIVKSRIYVEQ